jgi:hypothetical protein
MRKTHFAAWVSLAVALLSTPALAQRPRIDEPSAKTPVAENPNNPPPVPPITSKVKYEGGYFGYNQKMDGTLTIDDMNEQLIFRNKENKEMINIPYKAIMAAYGDTQSRRPAAASVIGSAVPYGLGLPALLIKKKYQYLNMQIHDDDAGMAGVVSFKFEQKETLVAMLQSIAEKSGLSARGEVFVRKRTAAPATDHQDN